MPANLCGCQCSASLVGVLRHCCHKESSGRVENWTRNRTFFVNVPPIQGQDSAESSQLSLATTGTQDHELNWELTPPSDSGDRDARQGHCRVAEAEEAVETEDAADGDGQEGGKQELQGRVEAAHQPASTRVFRLSISIHSYLHSTDSLSVIIALPAKLWLV